jgi:hypothetical protein
MPSLRDEDAGVEALDHLSPYSQPRSISVVRRDLASDKIGRANYGRDNMQRRPKCVT